MPQYLRQGILALAASLVLACIGFAVAKATSAPSAAGASAGEMAASVILSHNTLMFTGNILTRHQHFGRDSWDMMDLAADYLRSHPRGDRLYTDVLITAHHRFQYPPVSLLLTQRLNQYSKDAQERFYKLMGDISLLVLCFALYRIVLWSLRNSAGIDPRPGTRLLLLALCGLATLTYVPATIGVTMGNIQPWLNAAFALGLLCFLEDRSFAAGLLIGLITCLKPQLGLLAVWGLLRGHRTFAAGILLVAGLGAIVGIAQFGLGSHLDYLRGLSFLSRHGESYYGNQTLNGMLARLFGVRHPEDYHNLLWVPTDIPPFNPWVYYPSVVAGIVFIAVSLLVRPRPTTVGRSLDFCLMAVGATLASPIGWFYHYGILLPVFGFLWPVLCCDPGFSARRGLRIAALAAFVVSANFTSFMDLLAGTYWNFLQSYLLYAAVTLFIVLVLAVRAAGPAGQRSNPGSMLSASAR